MYEKIAKVARICLDLHLLILVCTALFLIFSSYIFYAVDVFSLRSNNLQENNPKQNDFPERGRIKTVEWNLYKNQSLTHLLKRERIPQSDILKLVSSISAIFSLDSLDIGQKIQLYIDSDSNNKNQLKGLVISFRDKKLYSILQGDRYISFFDVHYYQEKQRFRKIRISNNLYIDGLKNNIPVHLLHEIIKVLSPSIDFKKDITKDDVILVLYTTQIDDENIDKKVTKVLYLETNIRKKTNNKYYHYTTPDKKIEGLFNQKGELQQGFISSLPIANARITSSFGMRIHPTLRYKKFHRGIDIGAPKGTPIRATANGIITTRKFSPSYGNYIIVKHNARYQTLYAHMHNFNSHYKKGSLVKEGNIIGYVGSTGRSSGYHLHYEIIKDGKQINPLKGVAKKILISPLHIEDFIKYKSSVDDYIKNIENTGLLEK